MRFRRKAYEELKNWKEQYADRYAVLLEGARRVGKSTIAEHFAENEYKSYILIDFSNVSKDVLACFEDMSNPDLFFLRLQSVTGKTLYKGESVIIFDEVQLYPEARQAIKHLVKDGRYHYIETGSLISIKKNVKDILIPSEEMKIRVYPMDYEEFCAAIGGNYSVIENLYEMNTSVGQGVNRKLMKDFRLYMAVGGMPQAVEAFVNGENFTAIDRVKREIIGLYQDDFKKIDPSGKISAMYSSIPAQLAKDTKKYRITTALGKQKTERDEDLLYDLIDSKTALICYNSTDPRVSLAHTKDFGSYKLYVADTGLFVTMMFMDRPVAENDIYAKLLADKLPANLGFLYENVVAQMIAASGRGLYYHTWEKDGSTHYYEIDFLISNGAKATPIEVKSSGTSKHDSLDAFRRKFEKSVGEAYLISQKDVMEHEGVHYRPVYMVPFIVK